MPEHDQTAPRGTVGRRRFLQGTALAGVGAFLAACSAGNSSAQPSTPASGASVPVPTPPPVTPAPSEQATPKVITGPFHWAQWPAYIDLAGKAGEAGQYQPGSSPTLEEFKKKYSVQVASLLDEPYFHVYWLDGKRVGRRGRPRGRNE